MKEILAFAKEEFVAAKWYDKIWTIFLALCYITALVMIVYFILFEPSITIRVMFFFLWTVMMVAIGALIGVAISID